MRELLLGLRFEAGKLGIDVGIVTDWASYKKSTIGIMANGLP